MFTKNEAVNQGGGRKEREHPKIAPEDTHKPSMFRSYITVILSYLKLSYFILNLCIVEQVFTPHISVVYFINSQIRQLLANKTCLEGELALQDD